MAQHIGTLKEDIGITKHPRMKIVWRRLRWAGHIQRTSEKRLTMKALKTEEGGRRRRGKPKYKIIS